MIIGLTSPASGGKGEISKYLAKLGFKVFVISDFIREAAIVLNKNPNDRGVLQDVGNKFRALVSTDYWARLIDEMVTLSDMQGNIVIDGIRNPGEIDFLRDKYKRDFVLIGITVDPDKQRGFVRTRGREADGIHQPDKLDVLLRRDLGEGEADSGQQVLRCLEMANYKIENDEDIPKLLTDMEKILVGLGYKVKET